MCASQDGFIHWRPQEALPARPKLAAENDIKTDRPSRASSPDWETLWNQFEPEQASRETSDYSFASVSHGSTVSPLSLTFTPHSPELFAGLQTISQPQLVWDTPEASFAPSWSNAQELPDMPLLLGPEQASDHPDLLNTEF